MAGIYAREYRCYEGDSYDFACLFAEAYESGMTCDDSCCSSISFDDPFVADSWSSS